MLVVVIELRIPISDAWLAKNSVYLKKEEIILIYLLLGGKSFEGTKISIISTNLHINLQFS